MTATPVPGLMQFANLAQSTLAAAITTTTATTLQVASAASFPTVPNFVLVIQDTPSSVPELVLVTGISGTTFTVTRGYEGTTKSTHAAGSLITHILSAGVAKTFCYDPNLNFANFFDVTSSVDCTTALQNFLLHCQLVAYSLGCQFISDQGTRVMVKARCDASSPLFVSCPIIVPEFVQIDFKTQIMRDGRTGTITNNYSGDTTTKALANLQQPCVIIVPRAHWEYLEINCNPATGFSGSGFYHGGIWTLSAAAIGNAGNGGYVVNDLITGAYVSKGPYAPFTVRVTAVDGSGNPTAITLVTGGYYGLPPVLQAQQWTGANGFTGATAQGFIGSVFDGSGNFLTTGGTGTGLTITPTWQTDWVSANTRYKQFQNPGLISNTAGNQLYVQNIDNAAPDATYGAKFGAFFVGLNGDFGDVVTGGGYNGIYLSGSDLRFRFMNPVDSSIGVEIFAGGSIECPDLVVDTPTIEYLRINQTAGVVLKGRLFSNTTNSPITGTHAVFIGDNSSSTNMASQLDLEFECDNVGTAAGIPFASVNFMQGSKLDFHVSNYIGRTTIAPNKITGLYDLGTGNGAGNTFKGQIDSIYGPAIIGTVPNGCSVEIYDTNTPIVPGTGTATIGGTVTTSDVISIVFTNAIPSFSGTFVIGSPITVSYTTLGGDTLTTIATALAAAINANASCAAAGIIATSAAAVVTVSQPGSIANYTTMTATITGAATETVTFSNSGKLTGATSGGLAMLNGLYEIAGAGAPVNGVNGTGFNKAGIGSSYTDTTNGFNYINIAAASSPFWVKSSGLPYQIHPITGRYYPSPIYSGVSTANQSGTLSNYVVCYVPIFMPQAFTPKSMAFEVTTGSTAASWQATMGLHADNNGVPSTNPLIDIGQTSTGVLTIASSATGVQIQAIPVGNQVQYAPGWYWMAFISSLPASGSNPVFKGSQTNSTFTRAQFGDVLTQGSASPASCGYMLKNTNATTVALGTATSLSYNNSTNAPVIWIGL